MAPPRGISGLLFVLVACAPHERPQAPATPCPPGMVEIGGDDSPIGVSKVCMDVTEVTTAAYGACVHAGVCTPAFVGTGAQCNLTRPDRGDHPINCASWEQGQTYCGWLGKRLPDDEEWIWAAQGGAAVTPFPWGNHPIDAAHACWDRSNLGTCPVGQLPAGASPAGILDLVGNAAEWTRGYGKPVAGERGRLRGGSFQDAVYKQPINERFADSARDDPAEAATVTSGFRCVVAPHTPVQEVDEGTWTPYQPIPGGLPPVLAATPTPTTPTRPLANLAVLATPKDPPGVWWAVGTRVLPVAPPLAATLGLTEHLQVSAKPTALKDFNALRWLGDTVLMTNGSSYDLKLAAVEPATYKLRWQLAASASLRSYMQVVTPRVLVVLYSGESDQAVGYALDSGREVWRVRGADDPNFRKVQRVWSDGERGYTIGERGLSAFDANTGATLWAGVTLGEGCGAASREGVLIVEDPAGYRVLDPTTGQPQRSFGNPGRCGWGNTSWDRSIPGGEFAGGLLVTHASRVADDDTATLHAFDIASGSERWRRPKLGSYSFAVDQDAVFVNLGDDRLLALDASNGVTQAELSFGSHFNVDVQPGGGEAGPLVIVDAAATGQWILGRAPAPVPAESWTIRGRLVAEEWLPRGSAANVPVQVGEKIVRTDARGRFEVRGKGRGAIGVALGTTRGPDQRGGSRVTFEASPVILDGSGSYDMGDVQLSEWSLY